jgi:hypothetical protein
LDELPHRAALREGVSNEGSMRPSTGDGRQRRSEMASEYDALQYPTESTLTTSIARGWARDLAIVVLATVAAAAFAFFGGAFILVAILAVTLLAPVIAGVLAVLAVRAERRRTTA